MIRVKLFLGLIDGKVGLSMDYSLTKIMKEFKLELGL